LIEINSDEASSMTGYLQGVVSSYVTQIR